MSIINRLGSRVEVEAQTRVMTFRQTPEHAPEPVTSIDWLAMDNATPDAATSFSARDLDELFTDALGQYLVEWQPDRTKRARVQTTMIGVHAR